MEKVRGDILSPPVVCYAESKRINPEFLRQGGWNLRGQSFTAPAIPSSWTFLQIYFRGDSQYISDENLLYSIDGFRNAMPSYGIKEQNMVSVSDLKPDRHWLELQGSMNSGNHEMDRSNENRLRERLQEFRNHGKKISLVLITLPAKNTKLYATIKRVADVHVGVHTICTVAGWQRADGLKFWGIKHEPQFLGNLLLKYNLKLGGMNHVLVHPSGQNLKSKPTMLVGMDVTHPPPGSQNGAPSIAAIVATEEPTHFVNWPASLRLQTPAKDKMAREVIDDLQAMFRERLEHWKKKNNGKLPEKIIVYRDGVSDDFYDLVIRDELPRIRAAIAGAYNEGTYTAKLVYFIVLKRHSTRFFPSPQKNVTDRQLLDKNLNVMPGLLIRDDLTRRADDTDVGYFLQSHSCLKGGSLNDYHEHTLSMF
jgi:eukaryotic translation initiation factor 2C